MIWIRLLDSGSPQMLDVLFDTIDTIGVMIEEGLQVGEKINFINIIGIQCLFSGLNALWINDLFDFDLEFQNL